MKDPAASKPSRSRTRADRSRANSTGSNGHGHGEKQLSQRAEAISLWVSKSDSGERRRGKPRAAVALANRRTAELRTANAALRARLRAHQQASQAREALIESERNLNDSFDHAPLALFWVGPNGRIERANSAALELLGRTAKQSRGQPMARFFATPEAGQDALARLARKETLRNFRAALRGKDRRIRHVLIDANGLWEGGDLKCSRWFVRDITQRVQLEREILAISEREQQRLGQDLHDDLCQRLSAIEFLSQTLAGHLGPISRQDAARAREIAAMTRQAMNQTRALARGLSPVRLEAGGLVVALRELAARTRRVFRVRCQFHSEPVRVRRTEMAVHLYRITQEAVSNAIKHGRARRIDISLNRRGGDIQLVVRDNGLGLPAKLRPSKGMGLRVMRHRAGVIGGILAVQRLPQGGTGVVCTVKRELVLQEGRHGHEA